MPSRIPTSKVVLRNDMAEYIPSSQLDLESYYYQTEVIRDISEEKYIEFKEQLLRHPKYESIKDKFFLNDNKKSITHLIMKVPVKEVLELTEEERWFYPLCSRKEISRIVDPKNGSDYLLSLQANAVTSNPRLNRVFYRLRDFYGAKWRFSKYFNNRLFDKCKALLPPAEKEKCKNVSSGFINLNEVNGECAKTDFGSIVLVSVALRHFMYFMNLWQFGGQFDVDFEDRFYALIIAIRIMLGSESLDFEIDSRGRLPKKIDKELNAITDLQLEFAIGHEYAHHYLNHLDNASILHLNENDHTANSDVRVYNHSEQAELEADRYSIQSINKPLAEKEELLNSAFYFFAYADILECVIQYMYPPTGRPRRHPQPLERLKELRASFPDSIGLSMKEIDALITESITLKKHLLENFLPFQIDRLEIYGSAYLPGYKKEATIDRLDF